MSGVTNEQIASTIIRVESVSKRPLESILKPENFESDQESHPCAPCMRKYHIFPCVYCFPSDLRGAPVCVFITILFGMSIASVVFSSILWHFCDIMFMYDYSDGNNPNSISILKQVCYGFGVFYCILYILIVIIGIMYKPLKFFTIKLQLFGCLLIIFIIYLITPVIAIVVPYIVNKLFFGKIGYSEQSQFFKETDIQEDYFASIEYANKIVQDMIISLKNNNVEGSKTQLLFKYIVNWKIINDYRRSHLQTFSKLKNSAQNSNNLAFRHEYNKMYPKIKEIKQKFQLKEFDEDADLNNYQHRILNGEYRNPQLCDLWNDNVIIYDNYCIIYFLVQLCEEIFYRGIQTKWVIFGLVISIKVLSHGFDTMLIFQLIGLLIDLHVELWFFYQYAFNITVEEFLSQYDSLIKSEHFFTNGIGKKSMYQYFVLNFENNVKLIDYLKFYQNVNSGKLNENKLSHIIDDIFKIGEKGRITTDLCMIILEYIGRAKTDNETIRNLFIK